MVTVAGTQADLSRYPLICRIVEHQIGTGPR